MVWKLVDGGIVDPVPVSIARSLAPRLPVVAVVLNGSVGEPARLPSFHFPLPDPSSKQLNPLARYTGLWCVYAFIGCLRSHVDRPASED